MKRRAVIVACLTIVLALAAPRASDQIGCYAIVEKVVLEPNAKTPDRVQIWGVFAMGVQNDASDYQKPLRGYLYFRAPDYGPAAARPEAATELARNEWADLLQIAGTRQVVGFGSRYSQSRVPPLARARVRPAGETPTGPEMYDLAGGIVRVRNTDYAPIKSLLEFPR